MAKQYRRKLHGTFARENGTVTVAHSRNKRFKEVQTSRYPDCCNWKRALITSEYIKEGAVVIDVGMNVMNEPSLRRCFDFGDVTSSFLQSPVPAVLVQ
ncbi:MAG: hypothetical protein ACLU92_12715 [Coprococcus comes]